MLLALNDVEFVPPFATETGAAIEHDPGFVPEQLIPVPLPSDMTPELVRTPAEFESPVPRKFVKVCELIRKFVVAKLVVVAEVVVLFDAVKLSMTLGLPIVEDA